MLLCVVVMFDPEETRYWESLCRASSSLDRFLLFCLVFWQKLLSEVLSLVGGFTLFIKRKITLSVLWCYSLFIVYMCFFACGVRVCLSVIERTTDCSQLIVGENQAALQSYSMTHHLLSGRAWGT